MCMAPGALDVADNNLIGTKRKWGEINKVYARKVYRKRPENAAASGGPTPVSGGSTSTNGDATTKKGDVTKVNGDVTSITAVRDGLAATEPNGGGIKSDNGKESGTVSGENSSKQVVEEHLFDVVVSDQINVSNEVAGGSGEADAPNGVAKKFVTRLDNRLIINLKATPSEVELKELQETLTARLDLIRRTSKNLEEKEAQINASSIVVVEKEAQINASSTVDVGGNVGESYAHTRLTGYTCNELVDNTRGLVTVDGGGNVGESYTHPRLTGYTSNGLVDSTRGSVTVDTGGNVGEPYTQPRIMGYTSNELVDNARGLVPARTNVGFGVNQGYRLFRPLSVSVANNSYESVEKEKRTPKENKYYRNSDFLLGKDRLPPENRRSKSNVGRKRGREPGVGNRNQVFRNCNSLLHRLMKHKHGWVFNEPVNAKLLGLHDYHDIIKNPMDLGTIKSKLEQNLYKSPKDFADDVRLTFHNAMTYNPKGQDVHVMAERLLDIFEEKWAEIESNYNIEGRYGMSYDVGFYTPTPRKAPPISPAFQMRAFDRSQSMPGPFDSRPKTTNIAPVIRTPVPKKPKAKDPNKRNMTFEEKQKLSTNLQNLPSEKLDSIIQIIKKRNTSVSQNDDEIEVDIDGVDIETLWELDRFVLNYKKSLSKHKRRAELALQARAAAGHGVPTMNPGAGISEAQKENNIADGRSLATNATVQGPTQRERERDDASRSSSSSSSSSDSGSSSSSDSDSDSSSANGSDAGH